MGKNNKQRRELKKRKLNRTYPKTKNPLGLLTLPYPYKKEPWQKGYSPLD